MDSKRISPIIKSICLGVIAVLLHVPVYAAAPVFWNRLSSLNDISNSIVGQNMYVNQPVTFTPCKYGNGITPKATSAISAAIPSMQFMNPEEGCVEFWLRINSPALNNIHAYYFYSSGYQPFAIYHYRDGTTRYVDLFITFGGATVTTRYDNEQLPVNTPMHLALVWKRSGIEGSADTIRLYLNGAKVHASQTAGWGTTPGSGESSLFYSFLDVSQGDHFSMSDLKMWTFAQTRFTGENVSFFFGNGRATMYWNMIGYDPFIVSRSDSSNGIFSQLGVTSDWNYIDTSALNDHIYYYRLGGVSNGLTNTLGVYEAATLKGIECDGYLIKARLTNTIRAHLIDSKGRRLSVTGNGVDTMPFTLRPPVGSLINGASEAQLLCDASGGMDFNYTPIPDSGVHSVSISNSPGLFTNYPLSVVPITLSAYAKGSAMFYRTNMDNNAPFEVVVTAKHLTNVIDGVSVQVTAANGLINTGCASAAVQTANGNASVFFKPIDCVTGTSNYMLGTHVISIQSPSSVSAPVILSIAVSNKPLPDAVPDIKGAPIPDVLVKEHRLTVLGESSDLVNRYTGNLKYTARDIAVKTLREPMTIERTYNSLAPERGPFGYGWSFNCGEYLSIADAGDVKYAFFHRGDGATVTFTCTNTNTMEFTNMAGSRDKLAWSTSGAQIILSGGKDTYNFDANGLRTKALFGGWVTNEIAYIYDTEGRLVTVMNTMDAESIDFTYDANGLITNVFGPMNTSYSYAYDADSNLTNVTGRNAEGIFYTASYQYGSNHTLTNMTDPKAPAGYKKRSFVYDAENRVNAVKDAYQNAFTYVYTTSAVGAETNFVTIMTDEMGKQLTQTYTKDGILTNRTDTALSVEHFAFTNGNNLTWHVDKNGNTNEYTFNERYDMTSHKDARGNITSYNYEYRVDGGGGGCMWMSAGGWGSSDYSSCPTPGCSLYIGYSCSYMPIASHPEWDDFCGCYVDVPEYGYSATAECGYYSCWENPYTFVSHSTTTTPSGATIDYNYNIANGEIETVTYSDGIGNRSYGYDPANLLIASYGDEDVTRFDIFDMSGNRTNSITYHPNGASPWSLITNTMLYDPIGRKTNERNLYGEQTHYFYNGLDQLVKVIHPDGTSNMSYYDTLGRLVRTVDEAGFEKRFAYDECDRITNAMDENGKSVSYVYDHIGNIVRINDAKGGITANAYDAAYRLSAVTNALLQVKRMGYDRNGNMTALTNELNAVTLMTYDANNNLHVTKNALGYSNVSFFDGLNRAVTNIGYDGATNRTDIAACGVPLRQYDTKGDFTETIYNSYAVPYMQYDKMRNYTYHLYGASSRNPIRSDDLDLHQTEYYYDINLNVTRSVMIGALVNRTNQFIYDSRNRLLTNIDAAGYTTIYAYDGRGLLTNSFDKNGAQTRYEYDGRRKLTRMVDALSGVTSYGYDENGNRTNMIDARGNQTRYEYDALNRLTRTVDALGNAVTTVYDAANNPTAVIDARGNTNSFVYDALNRVTTAYVANGSISNRYSYDPMGRKTQVIDPAGFITRFEYDILGNLIREIDALTNTNAYAYDVNGNRTAATNKSGYAMLFLYDKLNRVTNTIDTLTNTNTVYYSAFGEVTNIVDFDGRTNTMRYDSISRVTNRIDKMGALTRYEYDGYGNITRSIDALNNTTVFTYDRLNRLTNSVDAAGGITRVTYDAAGNRLSLIDALNRTTSFGYDKLNRLIATTNALNAVDSIEYDAAGNVSRTVDRRGMQTRFAYDAANRVTNVQDHLNYSTRYEYDTRSLTTAVYDKLNNATRLEYDALARRIREIDALTNSIRYAYDAMGNLTNVIDKRNFAVTKMYDAKNRLVAEIDPLGNSNTYAYDNADNIVMKTEKNGAITRFGYDAEKRIIAETNTFDAVRTFSYDALGRLFAATNYDGSFEQRAYDALGRMTNAASGSSDIAASTRMQQLFYDKAGNVITNIAPNASVTKFYYNALNQLIAETNAIHAGTRHAYDAAGNRTNTIDARGNQTRMQYDALNRVTNIIDANGASTKYFYNANGASTNLLDPNSRRTMFIYDALSRVTEKIDHNGKKIFYAYDAAGNVTNETDKLSNSVRTEYDAFNRAVKRVDALQGSVYFVYDAMGALISQTNSPSAGTTSGAVYSYAYDALARVTNEIDPLGKVTRITYDIMGRVLSKTKPAGESFAYTYDTIGRLTNETHLTAAAAVANTISYNYDTTDNIISIRDTNANITYKRDVLSRVTNEAVALVAGTFTSATKYLTHVYDSNNNRVCMIDYEMRTNIYGYDKMNRMTNVIADSLILGQKLTNQYKYDRAGYRTNMILPNTMRINYTFNALYNVSTIRYQVTENGIAVPKYIDKLTYSYDLMGNVTRKAYRDGNEDYKYDRLYQLTNVTYPGGAYERFKYDLAGNRTNSVSYDKKTTLATTYTYDAANKLIATVAKITNVTFESVSYAYNDNGEMTSRATTISNATTNVIYERLPDGKVSRILYPNEKAKGTNEFTYSALIQRMKKIDSTGTNYYLYDGDNAIYTYSSSNLTSAQITRRIMHGVEIDTPIVAEVLVRNDISNAGTISYTPASVKRYYHLSDAIGKVQYLVDDKQQVVQAYRYTAFGEMSVTGEDQNLYTYTGREYDVDSKMYYYRSRFYDPRTARFDRVDDKRDGLNWYAYVNNNPVRYVDPWGYMEIYSGLTTPDMGAGLISTATYGMCRISTDTSYSDDGVKTTQTIRTEDGRVITMTDIKDHHGNTINSSTMTEYKNGASEMSGYHSAGVSYFENKSSLDSAGIQSVAGGYHNIVNGSFGLYGSSDYAGWKAGTAYGWSFGGNLNDGSYYGDINKAGQTLAAIIGNIGSGADQHKTIQGDFFAMNDAGKSGFDQSSMNSINGALNMFNAAMNIGYGDRDNAVNYMASSIGGAVNANVSGQQANFFLNAFADITGIKMINEAKDIGFSATGRDAYVNGVNDLAITYQERFSRIISAAEKGGQIAGNNRIAAGINSEMAGGKIQNGREAADIALLTKISLLEGRNIMKVYNKQMPDEVVELVAWVVKERTEKGGFGGNSIADVIFHASYDKNGKINARAFEATQSVSWNDRWKGFLQKDRESMYSKIARNVFYAPSTSNPIPGALYFKDGALVDASFHGQVTTPYDDWDSTKVTVNKFKYDARANHGRGGYVDVLKPVQVDGWFGTKRTIYVPDLYQDLPGMRFYKFK